MRTSIIIPAYNEAGSIGNVLDSIPDIDDCEIVVVDGGSGDDTFAIAEAWGTKVLLETQRGYGRACSAGVEQAVGDILVFMDADGADDPNHLPGLINPVVNGKADLVLGSRLAGKIQHGAMPRHQFFGNWISALLIRWFYHIPITDLSPFRAVKRQKLLSLDMQEMTYGWPTEMIVKAARQNWVITEIPVNYYPRSSGKSKISGTWRGTVLATYYILSTIFKYSRRQIG
jgi:glycosyltransferase involved in cell wall biosynthesis